LASVGTTIQCSTATGSSVGARRSRLEPATRDWPCNRTLFASALVVSRVLGTRSTDFGLSAGILAAGPDQRSYSLSEGVVAPLNRRKAEPGGGAAAPRPPGPVDVPDHISPYSRAVRPSAQASKTSGPFVAANRPIRLPQKRELETLAVGSIDLLEQQVARRSMSSAPSCAAKWFGSSIRNVPPRRSG
jgi:hypothetical protein